MDTTARPVERDSPVSAWGQIARQLRARIESGALQPGARMATEHELAGEFGVSRITIRQALASLARDQLIERRQGSGTFVSMSVDPVQHDLFLATPWRERFVAAGHSVESTLTTVQEGRFPADLLQILAVPGLSGVDEAVLFARVHRVDGRAIGITESWVPADVGRDLMGEPLHDGSLSETLRDRHGLIASQIENYVSVATADATQARLLRIALDAPLLVVSAGSWTADERLVEVSRTSWVGSRVRFHFRRD